MITVGKVVFRKKYEPILNKLKEEVSKSDVELDIESAKKLIAKTIINVLNEEGEKLKWRLKDV